MNNHRPFKDEQIGNLVVYEFDDYHIYNREEELESEIFRGKKGDKWYIVDITPDPPEKNQQVVDLADKILENEQIHRIDLINIIKESQLMADVKDIADCINLDLQAGNINDDTGFATDVYRGFSQKYDV